MSDLPIHYTIFHRKWDWNIKEAAGSWLPRRLFYRHIRVWETISEKISSPSVLAIWITSEKGAL